MRSRVHRLRTFDKPGVSVYIKRDDELSFGVSGSKVRKYSSLIPYLEKAEIEEAVVAGGSYSNNVLALAQLLREKGIKPIFFLSGRPPEKITGNFLFTSLIVPLEDIHWTADEDVESAAAAHAQQLERVGKRVKLIPMGARMEESIEGVFTLVEDIQRNEKELGITFDHLFLDAGTGMTAATTIVRLAQLGIPMKVHVIQMASNREKFEDLLSFIEKRGPPLRTPLRYALYQPRTARSFGSTNAAVWEMIFHMARYEGVLVDPLYNAKLFGEGRQLLKEGSIQGNVLFVHSGGGLALAGFMEELGIIQSKNVKSAL